MDTSPEVFFCDSDDDLDQALIQVAQNYIHSLSLQSIPEETPDTELVDIKQESPDPDTNLIDTKEEHSSENLSLLSNPSSHDDDVMDTTEACFVSEPTLEQWSQDLMKIEYPSPPLEIQPDEFPEDWTELMKMGRKANVPVKSEEKTTRPLEFKIPMSEVREPCMDRSNNINNTTPVLGRHGLYAPKRKIWDVYPENDYAYGNGDKKRKSRSGPQIIKNLQKEAQAPPPKIRIKFNIPQSTVNKLPKKLHTAYKGGKVANPEFNVGAELLFSVGCLPEVSGRADAYQAIAQSLYIDHSRILIKMKKLNKVTRKNCLFQRHDRLYGRIDLDEEYDRLLRKQLNYKLINKLNSENPLEENPNTGIEPPKVLFNVENGNMTSMTIRNRKFVIGKTAVMIPRLSDADIQSFLAPPKGLDMPSLGLSI